MTAAEHDELTMLALAAGRGEQRALDDLVRATQADVWRFCASLNGRDAADDLTQETFARAIPALARFNGSSTVRTWLLAIARNTAADSVRRRVRRRRLIDRVELAERSRPTHHASGANAVDWMQLVDRLDPARREAFVLTQLLGLDYADAAGVVGCPIGTIRSRVARARQDLLSGAQGGASDLRSESGLG